MSWFAQQWAVYTPTAPPVDLTDSPSAERDSGPDGSLTMGVVLTDSPSAIRHGGPNGSLAIDIFITGDLPGGLRLGGPDGSADVGVVIVGDSPSAERDGGPDGAVAIDLSITDRPRGYRSGGPDGAVALGVTFTDGPSAERYGGPDGSVFIDVGGGVTLTDTPQGSRYDGPDGSLAVDIIIVGGLPRGDRLAGPDGALVVDIVLTDSPVAGRYGGPDGLLDPKLGDLPSGSRYMGPDGSMGIALPITGVSPSGARLGGPLGTLVIGVGADVIAGTTSPGQGRYGGPDGYLTLAFLPSKPPYIPLAPTIAPSYRLWLADTVTGKMLYQLPATTFSWSTQLNSVGTIRAMLAVEQAWDALSDQDEREPRILLREILSGPWRFCLVLKWGYDVVWAGPYISLSRPRGDQLELGGAEIGKVFSKRVLIKPGATFATDVTADTVFGPNVTKQSIAAGLINQAMAGTGNALPITATDPGGSGQEFRTYYGYDLSKYWDKLQALTAESDGPEIRFDPKVSPGVDGDYLSWTAQIGTPHLGRNVTTWVFDNDVNSVVGLDGDGSNVALGMWSSGSGQSRDKLTVHTTDTSLLKVGWPMLEEVDTSQSSETSYPVLVAQGASALSASKKPLVAFKVSVPADTIPSVGTYRVGEDFSVDIHGDPIIPDGFYTRRIAALSGSEKPWVTITDAEPLPVGSL